jgi:hypothetical protein
MFAWRQVKFMGLCGKKKKKEFMRLCTEKYKKISIQQKKDYEKIWIKICKIK